ncbi:hypothetical protein K458DRAFT_374988 [Lentithecium fluviatile CBS 122367]|uniref:Exosome complex protein n=1 Tax=Lentithecium fluviatile CBS 122367 TaxID=1168545 RepID=A0A6G1IN93_9PLEO|nr:hypothetical protein K458DRAFT_374988 [Lentithecium fluviatile CBS 122367]
MDPQTNLLELVDDLECNIDELTTALNPLLTNPLHTTASTLPLLDKAKLYVFSAYAIESLLYSTLQASGTNAREHPIFKELARLKSYSGKIKIAEEAGEGGNKRGPQARLDKGAAARFIRHGLAGNERFDLERAERIAKEKAKAALKARQIHLKFEQKAEEEKLAQIAKKRKAEEEPESENDDFYGNEATSSQPPKKKPRISTSDPMNIDKSTSSPSSTSKSPRMSKKDRKLKKKSLSNPTTPTPTTTAPSNPPPTSSQPNAAKKAEKKEIELVLPERAQNAPKTRSETFNALLNGTLAEQKKGKDKLKGGGKRGKGKE